jgi:hypothetical protein
MEREFRWRKIHSGSEWFDGKIEKTEKAELDRETELDGEDGED